MECSVCKSKNVTKLKDCGPAEAIKEGTLGAAAGGAFASAIPIPLLSTAVGALAGGVAGVAAGIRDEFKCNECGSLFKAWDF